MSTNPSEKQLCVQCGKSFVKRTMHWQKSSTCDFPEITDNMHQILTGLLMGDGWVHTGSQGNPRVGIKSVTKPFLDWLDNKLTFLSKWVTLKHTSEQVKNYTQDRLEDITGYDASGYNYSDVYLLESITHPQLVEYLEWYSTGEKVIPDIELTSLIAKIWYVCDGGVAWKGPDRASLYISSINESHRLEELCSWFDVISPTANTDDRIHIKQDEVDKFLDWIGDPIPGFEYKWETTNRQRYDRLKQ